MTAKTILLNWITEKSTKGSSHNVFYSYDIELTVPVYGKIKYGKIHTASTYSRIWRELRENNVLEVLGIGIREITHNKNKKVKGWIAMNMKAYGIESQVLLKGT